MVGSRDSHPHKTLMLSTGYPFVGIASLESRSRRLDPKEVSPQGGGAQQGITEAGPTDGDPHPHPMHLHLLAQLGLPSFDSTLASGSVR